MENSADKENLLFNFFYTIFKRKWLITFLFFITLCMVLFFSYLMTPTWEATTLILIEANPKNQVMLFPNITTPGPSTSPTSLPKNFVELLTGRNMAYEVVKEFGLDKRLEQKENAPEYLRDKIKNAMVDTATLPLIILRKIGILQEPVIDYTEKAAGRLIDRWEDMKVVEETQVISLTVDGETPQLAMDVANFMARRLKEKTINLSNEGISSASESTKKNLEDVESKLIAAQEELKNFREREKVISLSAEEAAIVNRYSDLESKYNLSLNEKKILSARLNELDRQLKNRDSKAIASTTIAENPLILGLKSRLIELETKLGSLLNEKKGSHPDVVSVKTDIDKIKAQLKDEVEKTVQSEVITPDPIYQRLLEEFTDVETKYYTVDAEIEALSRTKSDLNNEMLRFPQKEVEYARLSSMVEVYHNLSKDLKSRLEEMRILSDSNANEISMKILDKAYIPPTKDADWPIWILNIIAGIFLAGTFAFGYPFFVEYWDNSIRRKKDIEEIIETPILGILPYNKKFKKWNSSKNGNGFYDLERIPSLYSNVKLIATNLMLVPGENNNKAYLVTSLFPSEGKTTVASSISQFFSTYSKDTLLFVVKAEKKPDLPAEDDVPNLEKTMMQGYKKELMKGTNGNACYLVSDDMLSLKLWNAETINNFFEGVRSNFDIVFIDAPSINDNQLSLFMAPLVDGVILVIDEKTKKEQILHTKKKIEMSGGHLTGIVLNRYYTPIPHFISERLRLSN